MMHLTIISGSKKFQVPILGFGAPSANTESVHKAVLTALDFGFRHIDTAYMYDNEVAIGAAIKKWINDGKGKREDLFVTTKLPIYAKRGKDVEKYLKLSLQNLQLDYVDLFLIHTPLSIIADECSMASLFKQEIDFVWDVHDNVETWKRMEEQVENGLTRAIGLSNFNAAQVETIYINSKIKPAVLQVEVHAYLQQKELRQFCKKRNIAVTAFSPLGGSDRQEPFISKCISTKAAPIQLRHPIVIDIASKHNKSPAQILLKHLVQQDVVVIPRSIYPQELKENIDIFDFELSTEDLEKLNQLDLGEDGRSIDYQFLKGSDANPQCPFRKPR